MNRLILLFVWLAIASAARPHIMFLMLDDYGWANIGYHNTSLNDDEIRTPNLDSLKDQGIELDRHYVYRFCSPTRSAFLSGRNPIHVNTYNMEFNYNPANNVSGYAGVPINMTMISKKMKLAGYTTRFTGKWDAGWATQYHIPINRGFDSGFGYFTHANDYWSSVEGSVNNPGCANDLWNNTSPASNAINPSYCSQTNQTNCVYEDDRFLGDVLRQLDGHNRNVPLFYYWAPHNFHTPLQVPQKYLDMFPNIVNSDRRYYSAMVAHADDMIGQVVQKLKDKNMWNNTLLVMSSDNGGPVYSGGGANNYPLRGGKTSNWEGGIRVNALVSGGYLPLNVRSTKNENFIAISDWYATFCGLAGIDPTDFAAKAANLPPIDSYDMWPLLSGANTTNPRTEIPIGQDIGDQGNNVIVQGIIIPPWKMLLGDISTSFYQGPLYPNVTTDYALQSTLNTSCGTTGCLYNIITDPTESKNVTSHHPIIAQNMRDRIAFYQSTVFNVNRGPRDPKACITANSKYGGFLGPWVDPIFT